MFGVKTVELRSIFRKILPRKTNYAAVDVGAGDIKVLEIDARGSWPCVVAYGRFPTPYVRGEEYWDEEALSEAIYAAAQTSGLKIREVYTTIGGESVITRHVKVPVAPPREMESSVLREAEKFLPLPLEEVSLRFIKLGEEPFDGKKFCHILVAAAPSDLIRRYYEMFFSAGLLITALDLQSLSLWRVFFGLKRTQNGGTVAVLDIGSRSTQLVVVRDGCILFTRTLPVGGNLLTQTVADICGLDFESARQLKEEKGELLVPGREALSGQPSAVRVDFSLQEGLSELLGEIHRSLDFYQAQEPSAPIERFILSGGTSKLRGIKEWLGESVDMPVELGHLPVLKAQEKDDGEILPDPSFAVVLGTALREVI